MLAALLVFLGGGTGAVSRYFLVRWCSKLLAAENSPENSPWNTPWGSPWGSLLVNIIGSYILGFLAMSYRQHVLYTSSISPSHALWQRIYVPLLFIGFCGGFTTFSSYIMDVYNQFLAGNFLRAGLLLLLHVIAGLLAAGLGIYLARQMTSLPVL